MNGQFHDFEIFARIVETGNMSAAGRELGLSPALVSKRIKRLEERLGVRLFQRTTRQTALTDVGQGFYERVQTILASLQDAEDYVTRRTETVRGTLRITAPTSFGRLHIAPHLKTFLDLNPELSITLDLSDEFVDLVADNYDIAIRIAELTDSSHVARKLASNTRILCATPEYLEKNGQPRNVADLRNHQCLHATSQGVWRLTDPTGTVVTMRPESVLTTNSSEVVREALLAGVGIAIRSTWDVGKELADGRLRVVLPSYRGSTNVGVYALYPSKHYLPTKVRTFLNYALSLYGGNVPYWEQDIVHLIK